MRRVNFFLSPYALENPINVKSSLYVQESLPPAKKTCTSSSTNFCVTRLGNTIGRFAGKVIPGLPLNVLLFQRLYKAVLSSIGIKLFSTEKKPFRA